MTRIRMLLIIGVALLSFGAGMLHGGAFAAPPSAAFLPVVQAQSPQLAPGIYTLIESDTTFVSADRDASTGRIFVSYIDRAHGNRAHLTELIGAHLVEVAPPGLAGAPAYVPDDSPKDADVAVLAFNGWVYWFTSSREINEAGQPFKLKLRVERPGSVPTPTPAKVPPSATPVSAGPSRTPLP